MIKYHINFYPLLNSHTFTKDTKYVGIYKRCSLSSLQIWDVVLQSEDVFFHIRCESEIIQCYSCTLDMMMFVSLKEIQNLQVCVWCVVCINRRLKMMQHILIQDPLNKQHTCLIFCVVSEYIIFIDDDVHRLSVESRWRHDSWWISAGICWSWNRQRSWPICQSKHIRGLERFLQMY